MPQLRSASPGNGGFAALHFQRLEGLVGPHHDAPGQRIVDPDSAQVQHAGATVRAAITLAFDQQRHQGGVGVVGLEVDESPLISPGGASGRRVTSRV